MKKPKTYYIDEALLTRDEAARFLRIKPQTLRNWALKDPMPIPFYKLGGWHVRYKKSDLLEYVNNRRIENRADYAKCKRKVKNIFRKED